MSVDCDEVQEFFTSIQEWICESYYVDLKYIGRKSKDNIELLCVDFQINPLPFLDDLAFEIDQEFLFAGRIQKKYTKKEELIEFLRDASVGWLTLPFGKAKLACDAPSYSYYSETLNVDRWFFPLHLNVYGSVTKHLTRKEQFSINNQLRKGDVPFDGLNELTSWLGFDANSFLSGRSSLNIYINPPVDLIFSDSSLHMNNLRVTLKAHAQFPVEKVSLSIVSSPKKTPLGRVQLASKIDWSLLDDNLLTGSINVALENADSVLLMLIIGNYTVRRQWILDPAKTRNHRLLAVQHFDADLKMIRKNMFTEGDSNKFEITISALFYMLGFSPSIQAETESPDLIVSTPNGRMLIIECTLKVGDVPAKVGKLVNRKNSLIKNLKENGYYSAPIAVLICRAARDEIAADDRMLKDNGIALVTQENLHAYLLSLREMQDPDQIAISLEENYLAQNLINM